MRTERKKLLIVDDEPSIREFLAGALGHRGYATSTAVDGVDGLEKAIQIEPDLILLDVMMPKMDGWEMLSQLRKQEETCNIPVVMLTAKGETEALLKSANQRVVDYFIKPVNMDELLKFIRRYVELKG